jgi:hypothetical protein
MPRRYQFRYAPVALVLVLVAYSSAQCAPLGRLFFSAGERAKLDAIRNAPKAVVPTPQVTQPAAPIVPDSNKKPRSVMVAAPRVEKKDRAPQRRQVMTGFVERSSGANTVWMNNQAQHMQGGYGELDPLDVGKARRK